MLSPFFTSLVFLIAKIADIPTHPVRQEPLISWLDRTLPRYQLFARSALDILHNL
jgi:hypothetical protein